MISAVDRIFFSNAASTSSFFFFPRGIIASRRNFDMDMKKRTRSNSKR